MNPMPGDLFARRLRQERERLQISQAELASRMAEVLGANVDPSAIARIEQQTRAVRLDQAVAAAKALGVPLMLLLSDDPIAENEAQLQQVLVDLKLAQRTWDEDRLEVERLLRVAQALLDPRLKDSIDDRIADVREAADDNANNNLTNPDK